MNYEALAEEYYDERAHPTCFNLTSASLLILEKWTANIVAANGITCDLGCGRSLVAPMFERNGVSLENLHLIDASPGMLKHSLEWGDYGARLACCDVCHLPFEDGTVPRVVCSLGDPYNTDEFWQEMARILSNEGSIVFTSPSHEWSSKYRASHDGGVSDKAYFVTRNGEPVYVPSYIFSEQDQRCKLESHGFLVKSMIQVRRKELGAESLSPKLLVVGDEGLPIVSGYLIEKRSKPTVLP